MDSKNLFITHFAVGLLISSLGLPGWLSLILGFFGEKLLGALLDEGILIADLSISSLKVAMSESEYKDEAEKAYATATARVYTEAEKAVIRAQYLDAISRFGAVGNGMRK